MAESRSRRARGANALRGLDAVPATPPTDQTSGPVVPELPEQDAGAGVDAGVMPETGDSEGGPAGGEGQQAGKPVTNVGNEQAGKPRAEKAPKQPEPDPDEPEDDVEPEAPAWGIENLVSGIDPEKDRKQSGLRVPRYVATALGLYAQLTGQEQQDVASTALKAHVPADLLDLAYRQLYGRERPHL